MAGSTARTSSANIGGNTGGRLYEMLKNDLMTESDVVFLVQNTEIQCHWAVVASYGGYLRGLLSSCTTRYPNRKIIRLKDEKITPQAFRTILQYIYTSDCDVNQENVSEVIYAAKEFNMEDCVVHCVGLIKKQSEDGSQELQHAANKLNEVYESLVTGIWADTRGLSKVSREYFKSNAKKIVQDKKYLDFSSDVLELFCSTGGTGFSQKELFELCIVWAKRQCRVNKLKDTPTQLRSLLSEVLKKLRFAEMSTQEFMDYVLPTFILNNEEVGKVIADRRKKSEDTKVKVLIKKHYYNDTEAIEVELSTKILALKKLDFWKRRYTNELEMHHDLFALSHEDKVLSDDTCLESICSNPLNRFQRLDLEVHSVVYNVKVLGTEIAFPITIEGKKVSKAKEIIQGHLHYIYYIHPDDSFIYGIDNSGLPKRENHEVDVTLSCCLPLHMFLRGLVIIWGFASFAILVCIYKHYCIVSNSNISADSAHGRLEL